MQDENDSKCRRKWRQTIADRDAKNGREEAADEQNEGGDENSEGQIGHFLITVHIVRPCEYFLFYKRAKYRF